MKGRIAWLTLEVQKLAAKFPLGTGAFAPGSASTALTTDSGGAVGWTTITNAMLAGAIAVTKLVAGSNSTVLNTSSTGTMNFGKILAAMLDSTVFGTTADIANVADTEAAGSTGRVADAGHVHDLTDGMILDVHVGAAAAIAMTKLQPNEFLAYASTQSNVTGDATLYTVVFANEIVDGNTRFNATSTYTASGSGLHGFVITLFMEGITAAMTDGDVKLVTSNRTYSININPANLRTASNRFTFTAHLLADMDDNDTAFVQVSITGGTKVVDIDGGDARSHFGGHLIG